MDPFEEFEFKPLTDGLGFHRKKTNDSAPVPLENPLKDKGLELIEDSNANPLLPPLPRKQSSNIPEVPESLKSAPDQGSAAVDEILKTLQKNRQFDFDNSKQKVSAAASSKSEYKESTWSFTAALLDIMLVLAASLLCMIILLLITKADLVGNLSKPDEQGMIYLATLAVFAGVSFIYLVVNRVYVGCTPGEWAFDQQVGKPEELNTASYSLRVVLRSLWVIATGFIVLPLLSAITRKDIAGALSGARLYKKV